MMARKDSPFLNYWNNGFHQLLETGTYKKICQEAVKKHGTFIFDIISVIASAILQSLYLHFQYICCNII